MFDFLKINFEAKTGTNEKNQLRIMGNNEKQIQTINKEIEIIKRN